MLRIALIDLDYSIAELNEPLGIEMLAAALENLGRDRVACTLTCLQIPNSNYHSVFSEFRPHIVAISTKLGSLARIQDIVTIARSQPTAWSPLIILGGTLATLEPEELVRRFADTICVVGEGEEAIVGIARLCLQEGYPRRQIDHSAFVSAGIPNLVVASNGHVFRSQRSALVDLNVLPLPKRVCVPDVLRHGGLVRAEASRGCPWNHCTFCMIEWKYASRLWRPFGTDRIVRDVEHLSALRASLIYFTDEDFVGADIHRAEELCRALVDAKRRGLVDPQMRYYASVSVRSLLGKNGGHTLADPLPLLAAMRNAGFMGVFLGVESGSDSQLARYGKGASSCENLSVIRAIRHAGLECDIGFIMFDPATTLDEVEQNLSFLRSARLWTHHSRFAKRLRVAPGTRLFGIDTPGCCTPDYDADEAMRDLPFSDWRVDAIYRAFAPWERQRLATVLALQAKARATASQASRTQLTRKIGRLRSQDMRLLAAYATAMRGVTRRGEAMGVLAQVRQRMCPGRNNDGEGESHARR